jgi:hypothetical protein
MGRDIKKEIREALDYLPYNGDANTFYKEHKDYLKLLGYKDARLSPTRISLAYCLKNIKESSKVKSIRIEEAKFRRKKLLNALNKFLIRFNNIGKRGGRLGNPLVGRVKSEDAYLIYLPRVNTSYIQKKTKTKVNLFNTNTGFFSGIYISKKDKKVFFFRMTPYLYNWMKWFLKSKIKIKFESPIVKKYSPSILKQLLSNRSTKVFEIEIKYPQIDESGAVIIKSLNGTAYQYQKRIGQALSTTGKNPSIYDIDHISISYDNQPKIRIKFQRKWAYYIKFETNYVYEKQVPPKILPYLGENILLTDKVDKKALLNIMLQRGYLDKFDYENPYLKPFINKLSSLGVIEIKPSLKYYCESPGCLIAANGNKPSRNPQCPCGAISKNSEIDNYEIEINEDKIKKLLMEGIKKIGFSRYKTMPKKYLELKNSTIIRAEYNKDYIFFLFNTRGLETWEIDKLKLYGIPFLLINFKGETKSDMEGFNHITIGDLMVSIINNNFNNLKEALIDSKSKVHSLKLKSFQEGISLIKKRRISSLDFERAVFSIFNFIFLECQRWGGPRLPDGSLPFRLNKINYLLWDAKRYDRASLLNYIRSNGLKKDIRYMIKFNNNRIISRLGLVKYYLFITSNTKKQEFLSVKNEIKKQIEKSKRKSKLKRVNVSCLNKEDLKKLAKYFIDNYDVIISKYDSFIKLFRQELANNEGYFSFDDFKTKVDSLINSPAIYPTDTQLRKESI